MPVYVRTSSTAPTPPCAPSVIEQIVTNDHRAPLTEADRARGINQLLLDGVSPTKVARGLSTTRGRPWPAAKAAIESEEAMSALDTDSSTWWEATSFVEFDGDDAAQAELIRVAGTDQFDHRVAQLRAEREDRRRYERRRQRSPRRATPCWTVVPAGPIRHPDQLPSGTRMARP